MVAWYTEDFRLQICGFFFFPCFNYHTLTNHNYCKNWKNWHIFKKIQTFIQNIFNNRKSCKISKQQQADVKWHLIWTKTFQRFQRNEYRPHTIVKNLRNMKSVSHAKLPYFAGILTFWTQEQQEELSFLQMFISFAN